MGGFRPLTYTTMAQATATAKASTRYMDDEDDNEDVCRICITPGDKDNPLQYPCACRGSLKFVHQHCLLQWLDYSNAHRCEVCKHRFSFSPIYDEKAPTRLPLKEFVVGTVMKVWRCRDLHVFLRWCFYLLCFFLRLCLLLLVWFVIIPFVTFWIWRLAFVRSCGEAHRLLFLSHVSTTVVITDCFLGFVLSATIIYILRGAASLSNYFRHLGSNFEFYALVWFESPLFLLFKIAFTIPASNMIFLGVFIFVPFTLGRVILYHVAADLLKGFVSGPSKLQDITTLTVGYMFVVSLVLIYLGIIALIRYFKGESLSVVASLVPPLLGKFLEGIRLGTRAVLFVLLFGVVPLMCGWFLDVSTVMMFGKTISHRVEFLSVSPLARLLVYWGVGALCACPLSTFEELLREVLRPEAVDFLYDPEEEFEEAVHKFAREIMLAAAICGSLIVLLVFLPVRLAIIMAPSVFPLDIFVSDPFTEIPAGILLFTICTQFIIEHFGLWTTVQSLVRCWFTSVCGALGLSDLLLPRPEDNVGQDNGNGELERQNIGPERAMCVLPETAANVEQSDSEYIFVLRVVLLLLAAWVTLLLFNTALLVVPVSLGRALFNAIQFLPTAHGIIKYNDLYALVIGTYAFWIIISGTVYAIEHVKSERTSVFLNQIWKWCGIVFKSSALLAIWVFIIPVLIGLVFELLVIVPLRVPVDESHVFLLYQDWALGIIFLKIWTRLIILVDDSWEAKFERVEEDGFSRLQGLWVLREIVSPIVMKLLTVLCVPYVLASGVFPLLGYPLVVNSTVYRYAWIGCFSVSLLCFCVKRCHVWFRNLHSSIRDDRYLIGRKLHNFGEAVLSHQNQNQSSEDAGEGGLLIGSEEDADTGLRLRRAIQQEA